MSDSFIKKISGPDGKKAENPFNKLFEEKKNQLGIKPPEKTEEKAKGIDGIENLGNSPTKTDTFTMETEPAKIEPAPIVKEAPAEPDKKEDFLNKIPSRSLENADIFSDTPEPAGTLNLNTSSSYNNISFEEEAAKNPFTEEIINEVSRLLRENNAAEAVKLINKLKH